MTALTTEHAFRREARTATAHAVLIACLLLGALALRLTGIDEPSLEQRETQSALLARQWSISDRAALPEYQQRVLGELPSVVKPIEPPVLDLLTAGSFRLVGENFWFPRLASSLMWIVGGVFVYLIATRLTRRAGALLALALYLAWPYGAWLSRHFMPDATMVAVLLAASLTIIRYWEEPTRRRLLVAGAVSSLATAVKPGVAFLFLVALFVALAVSERRLRESLRRGRLPLFVGLVTALSAVYYLFGAVLGDFIWSEAGTRRAAPDLLVTTRFWQGWWDSASYLLRYPQSQELLALLPLAAGVAGFLATPRGRPRAILAGLFLGYVAFGLTFANYIFTNPYYSLPLVPILSLAIGVLAGQLLDARRLSSRRVRAALVGGIALVVGVAAYKSHAVLSTPVPRERIDDYRAIGEVTNHTTKALVVDDELSTPAMYWGWIVGRSWDLVHETPPPWIRPEEAEFLVVVGAGRAQAPPVAEFVEGLPAVAMSDRYAVFDLRGAERRRP